MASKGAGLWRRALSPTGPVGAQAISQAANLAGQLLVAVLCGQDQFGSAGFALMVAVTAAFVGELGYGTYFLRAAATGSDWLATWRCAAGQRLMVLAAAVPVMAVICALAAPHGDVALTTLAFATPGILLSAFLPNQVLFALGHARLAALGQILRFVVQGSGAAGVAWVWPGAADAGLGGAFSLGVAAQILLGLSVGLPAGFLRPAFARLRPEPTALRLWFVSLAGVAHDRVLLLVVAATTPQLLGWAVIGIQVLGGGIALLSQIDRLLVPDQARGGQAAFPATWPAAAAALGLGFLALLAWEQPATIRAAMLLAAAEWYGLAMMTWSYAIAFGAGTERRFSHAMLVVQPLSAVLQVALAPALGLFATMVWRSLVGLGLAWLGSKVALGERAFPLAPVVALAGAAVLMQVSAGFDLGGAGIGVAAALCLGWGVFANSWRPRDAA